MLTAEVLQALDFLPRDAFLGGVLRAAHGADAARRRAAEEIESAAVSILDEVRLNPSATARGKQLVVQPDALIRSANAYTLVELKGLRANSFGPRQLAKQYVTAVREAEGRSPARRRPGRRCRPRPRLRRDGRAHPRGVCVDRLG
ncbi:MAG: hypothetical protein H0T66_08930 [Geodermatophilaceae bacterium]|nr:hypothetical protein [Geodermatophilaceae bacterium]MDQ3457128.1 hypothetical protein [Actinomycetota bacterium]